MKRLVFSFFYTVLTHLAFAQQSLTATNLPIVIIKTGGRVIPDNEKVTVQMQIIDNGLGRTNSITDLPNNYNGLVGIELRGSSSQSLSPKKPYGFETRDAQGNNLDVPLMGLPAENDWVLLAPYADKTLIRDAFTYDMARLASTKYWIPRYRFCELVLDGNYQGVYMLLEKIKKGKNRVDISTMKITDNQGDDVTGGYILKLDKFTGSPSKFFTSTVPSMGSKTLDILYQIHYPKIEDITPQQAQYIENYVADFEKTLKGANFKHPVNGYQKFMNVDSFVDYFLATEISKNIDGFRLSTFFYKAKDSKGGKLTMGPMWDYNLTYGNGNFCDCWKPEGFQFEQYKLSTATCGATIPFWWDRLLQDSTFARRTVDRWRNLRSTVWKTDRLVNLVDSSAAALLPAQIRNFNRWPILGVWVWPNYFVGKNYNEEVIQMKNFLKTRLEWLDEQLARFDPVITALPPTAQPQALLSVWPNPVTNKALVSGSLIQGGTLKISLYTLGGEEVRVLTNSPQPTGKYEAVLNKTGMAPGVYILQSSLDGVPLATKKIVIE